MARKVRVEYSGAIYHVMNRGDRREPIFKSEADRELFVKTLGEACAKTGWLIHSYILMSNHFHMVVETPQPNLVAGMKWFLGTYTGRFNRRHKLFGHLFSGRYKSIIVDGSGTGYLKTACDYVHLNPARAKLLKIDQPLRTFVWSSWPLYLLAPSKRPAWLYVKPLLGEHGIPKDSTAGRRELERRVEAQRLVEETGEYKKIRRGWCLGGDQFRKELLAHMTERLGPEHYGAERMETQVETAERILAEELKRRKWREADLTQRPKGHPEKVKIARRLRAETVMTVAWISERLHLGSRNYANHLLAEGE
jgi:REP element-mobilizing transposase RayT